MARAKASDIYSVVMKSLQSDEVTRLGGVVENALMNPMKATADWSARFPIKLYIFGDQQIDGAGDLDNVVFFAVSAKMKRSDEADDRELEFLDLNDVIKSALHRQTVAENCVIMWQKSFIFYSTMTLTSNNRRITMELEDDEVGIMVFFAGVSIRLVALAADAIRKTGQEIVEGADGTTATQGELDLAEKAVKAMEQLF